MIWSSYPNSDTVYAFVWKSGISISPYLGQYLQIFLAISSVTRHSRSGEWRYTLKTLAWSLSFMVDENRGRWMKWTKMHEKDLWNWTKQMIMDWMTADDMDKNGRINILKMLWMKMDDILWKWIKRSDDSQVVMACGVSLVVMFYLIGGHILCCLFSFVHFKSCSNW